jgi:hypothetical protein
MCKISMHFPNIHHAEDEKLHGNLFFKEIPTVNITNAKARFSSYEHLSPSIALDMCGFRNYEIQGLVNLFSYQLSNFV